MDIHLDEESHRLLYILAKEAQKDWRARHLCLPSLVVALVLHDLDGFVRLPGSQSGCPTLFPLRKDGHRGGYASIQEAVLSHNTYLAEWKADGQKYPNWKELNRQNHYILAVQYLQDAQYPYYPEKEAEAELVELIEHNGLAGCDNLLPADFDRYSGNLYQISTSFRK